MTKEKSVASHKDDTTHSTSTIDKDTKDAPVDTQYASEEQLPTSLSLKNNFHQNDHIPFIPTKPLDKPLTISSQVSVPSIAPNTVSSQENNNRSLSSMACCAQSSHRLPAATASTLMDPSRNNLISHDRNIVQHTSASTSTQNSDASTTPLSAAMTSVQAQAVPASMSSLSASTSTSKKRIRNSTSNTNITTAGTCGASAALTLSGASGVDHGFSPGHVEHKKRKLSAWSCSNTDVNIKDQTITIDSRHAQDTYTNASETNAAHTVTSTTSCVALEAGPPPPLNSDDDHDTASDHNPCHSQTATIPCPHVSVEKDSQSKPNEQEQEEFLQKEEGDYGQLSLTQIHSFIDNVDIPSYEIKKSTATSTSTSLPLSSPTISNPNPTGTKSSIHSDTPVKKDTDGRIGEEALKSSSLSTSLAIHPITVSEASVTEPLISKDRISEAQGSAVPVIAGSSSVPTQVPLIALVLPKPMQVTLMPEKTVSREMNENAKNSTNQEMMMVTEQVPPQSQITTIQQQQQVITNVKPEINVSSTVQLPTSTSSTMSRPQLQSQQQHRKTSSFSNNSHSHTNSISNSNSTSNSRKPKITKSSAKQQNQSQPTKSSSSGRWSREEHKAFLEGLKIYGREWKKVAHNIPTRTSAQIRSHAQKYFAKLARDEQQQANMWLSGQSGGIHDSSPAAMGIAPSGHASLMSPDRIGLDNSIDNLPPSVAQRVEKIFKDPKGAEKEVEETLKRLRDRYNELQQRVREKEAAKAAAAAATSEDSNVGQKNKSAVVMPNEHGNTIHDRFLYLKESVGTRRLKQPAHIDDKSSTSTQNHQMTPVIALQPPQQQQTVIEQQYVERTTTTAITRPRLRNDALASKELIALTVLGGELFRSSSRENLNPSPPSPVNSTTGSATAETEASNNQSNNDPKEEDKADTDDTRM